MSKVIPATLFLMLFTIALTSMPVGVPTGVPTDEISTDADGTPGGADGIPAGAGDTAAGLDEVLPVVGSLANLKDLLSEAEKVRGNLFGGIVRAEAAMAVVAESASVAGTPAAFDSASADAGGGDFSRTNVQVQGVDEADVVKTDGRYIYRIVNQGVVIARVYPAADMRVVRTLDYAGQGFAPFALYVDEKHLVVVGDQHTAPLDKPVSSSPESAMPEIYPPPVPVRSTVKVLVYEISDKERITKVREAEVEGHHVSSRKVGSALYLVANKYIDYYIMRQEGSERLVVTVPSASHTPAYRDSAVRSDFVSVGYDAIRYFPGSVEANYLIVAGLNLDRPEQEMAVATYLGAGQNIYASPRNLYVAVTDYDLPPEPSGPAALVDVADMAPVQPPRTKTALYRFALDGGRVTFTGKGEVPGTLLNQFSMDEHGDHFRVATTTGEVWRTDEHTSKNHVYVLDRDLRIVGRLEDIAPGEKIYSARFLGDRAYLVTFRTVDPFFVLDLKDPEAPRILGALKIPGYSDYLHPYDENHVLGFGKETVEITQKDLVRPGGPATMAFYQGMKIALFDVTDVADPIELFKETIGDRGTESDLLRDHKALLFSREKNLLAFPVTVMERRGGDAGTTDPMAYGESFQGAYVYRIDLDQGFQLRGRITHLPAEDFARAGGWYDSGLNVDRILYIEDTLYTLSRRLVKAHDLGDLTERNSLDLR